MTDLKVCSVLLHVLILGTLITQGYIRFTNITLTETQLFLDYWYVHLGTIIVSIFVAICYKLHKE